MGSQNIYEYKKVKILEKEELFADIRENQSESAQNRCIVRLVNKINELIIEQNHLMKDLELYKKEFKQHLSSIDILPVCFGQVVTDKSSRSPI